MPKIDAKKYNECETVGDPRFSKKQLIPSSKSSQKIEQDRYAIKQLNLRKCDTTHTIFGLYYSIQPNKSPTEYYTTHLYS